MIVGDGEERKNLEKQIEELGGSRNIKILGEVKREKLIKLYENARTFVFTCQDDFGIAPVEAMSAGKPVIALKDGGVIETVIEGKTGEFFEDVKSEMIINAIQKLIQNEKKYDSNFIRQRAEEFGQDKFEKKLKEFASGTLSGKY